MKKFSLKDPKCDDDYDPYLQGREAGVREETIRRVSSMASAIAQMYSDAKDALSQKEKGAWIDRNRHESTQDRIERKADELVQHIEAFLEKYIQVEDDPEDDVAGGHISLLREMDTCYETCCSLYRGLQAFSGTKSLEVVSEELKNDW